MQFLSDVQTSFYRGLRLELGLQGRCILLTEEEHLPAVGDEPIVEHLENVPQFVPDRDEQPPVGAEPLTIDNS